MLTQFLPKSKCNILFWGVMCACVYMCSQELGASTHVIHMEVKGCARCLPQLLSTLFIDAEPLMEPRDH